MEKLLQVLFAEYFKAQKGFIEIRCLGRGLPASQEFFEDMPGDLLLAKLQNANKEGFNIYFGAAPRNEKRGEQDAIKHLVALWADIDCYLKTERDRKPVDKEAVLERLKGFEKKPSIIVDSGHGWHAYWLLDAPYEVVNREEARAVLKGLSQTLGGDTGTFDLCRVLRLPGFDNVWNPQKPVACTIKELHEDRRYDFADFLKYKDYAQSQKSASQTTDMLKPMPNDSSRSGYDMSLARALAKEGFSREQMIEFLPLNPYGKQKDATQHYLELTADKALEQTERVSTELHLNPKQLKDFYESTLPIQWLVQDIVFRGGVTVLSGQQSGGKSLLAQELARALATGESFLGRYSVGASGKVLIFDADSHPSELKDRYEDFGIADNLSIYLEHNRDIDVCIPRHAQKLIDYALQESFDLVVFDSLIRFHSKDENSSTDMKEVMRAFHNIAEITNAAILVLQHAPKPRKGVRVSARGSGEIIASAGKALTTRRDKKNKIFVITTEKTRKNETDFAFAIEENAGKLRIVAKDSEAIRTQEEEKRIELENKIVAILPKNENGAIGKQAIKEALGEYELGEIGRVLKGLKTADIIRTSSKKGKSGALLYFQ